MFTEAEKETNSKKDNIDSIKAIYKIAIETRNFEINQLIQRNNFFMLFQGVLLAAVLQDQSRKPFIEFMISLAGFLVSIYQLQMASGAKFWQEWWESRVDYFELLLKSEKETTSDHFFNLFATPFDDVHQVILERFRKNKRYSLTSWVILNAYSVGRAPIKVALILTIVWLALLLHCLDLTFITKISSLIDGYHFVQKN